MRFLLTLVLSASVVGLGSAQEKWAVEFGLDGKAIVAGPLVKQLKTALGAEYEKAMAEAMKEIGTRPDKIVALSGGYPKFEGVQTTQRPPYLVYELATAEDAAATITAKAMVEGKPKGFCPGFPNAVAYKSNRPNDPWYILDGTRIMVVVGVDDTVDVETVTTALANHPRVMKTIADAKSHQYLFVDGAVMNIAKQIPMPAEMSIVKPLLNTTSITWHATVTETVAIDLKATFVNEKDAEEAKETLDQLLTLGGIGLNVLKSQVEKDVNAPKDWKKMFDAVSTLRKNAKPKVEGTSVVVKTTAPLPENFGAFVAEATGKVGEASARMKSSNNLKQIALALHNDHDVQGTFVTNIYSTGDKPKALLSWRVRLLPYIEQDALYREFKMDEAWDSEHNKKLIAKMPATYRHPKSSEKEPGMTHYRTFAPVKKDGPKCMLPAFPGEKWSFSSITDGTSNTIFCAEAADPVIWTKPEALPFDPKGNVPRLGGLFAGGFNVALGDGSVHFLKSTIKDETLKALITSQGGEVVRIDD